MGCGVGGRRPTASTAGCSGELKHVGRAHRWHCGRPTVMQQASVRRSDLPAAAPGAPALQQPGQRRQHAADAVPAERHVWARVQADWRRRRHRGAGGGGWRRAGCARRQAVRYVQGAAGCSWEGGREGGMAGTWGSRQQEWLGSGGGWQPWLPPALLQRPTAELCPYPTHPPTHPTSCSRVFCHGRGLPRGARKPLAGAGGGAGAAARGAGQGRQGRRSRQGGLGWSATAAARVPAKPGPLAHLSPTPPSRRTVVAIHLPPLPPLPPCRLPRRRWPARCCPSWRRAARRWRTCCMRW